MPSSYRLRNVRKYKSRSKQNFIITLIITFALLYIAFFWILPNLIGGVGFLRNFNSPVKKVTNNTSEILLAPPVLNIPYEATNTAQIDITGYSTPKSKVELFIDDDKKQTVDVEGDGSFTFQNVSLSLGTNNIYGKTVDEAGKESLSSKIITVIFDNQKPIINLSEPDDNKIIQGGDKKVKFAGKTEVGVNIFINDSQIIVSKDGNFESYQSLNDGDNNFDIKAMDLASNITQISRRIIYTP